MNTWNVRIGINPLSWMNDDLPALGGATPLSTALREGAEIGYAGFELGNKFPKEPAALKATLAEYGLACVSGWYSGHLAEDTVDAEIDRCAAHMEKLHFNSCKVVVYGEVAGSIQGRMDTPLSKRPRFAGEAQWAAYAARLNAFGERCLQGRGFARKVVAEFEAGVADLRAFAQRGGQRRRTAQGGQVVVHPRQGVDADADAPGVHGVVFSRDGVHSF